MREGRDLTVVTYGATVYRALQAARQAEERGISVEILDLRSLNPVDWDTDRGFGEEDEQGARAHRGFLSFGATGRRSPRESPRSCTPDLDGPVRRLGATDTFVGYAPELEEFILPQTADILKAIEELAAF